MLLFPVVFQRGGRGASWLPPAWNSVAYFKPLAQGVSSSSSDFFRTLFVQTLRREGGRESRRWGSSSRLVLPPAAHLHGGGLGWDGAARMLGATPCMEQSPNPPGTTKKLEGTGAERQSQDPACKSSRYLSTGQAEHSQGRQLCCARGSCQAATQWKDPLGARMKSQPDPAESTRRKDWKTLPLS